MVHGVLGSVEVVHDGPEQEELEGEQSDEDADKIEEEIVTCLQQTSSIPWNKIFVISTTSQASAPFILYKKNDALAFRVWYLT